MVYVCPEKDIECSPFSRNWCGTCPKWERASTLGVAQPNNAIKPTASIYEATPRSAHEAAKVRAEARAVADQEQRLLVASEKAHKYDQIVEVLAAPNTPAMLDKIRKITKGE